MSAMIVATPQAGLLAQSPRSGRRIVRCARLVRGRSEQCPEKVRGYPNALKQCSTICARELELVRLERFRISQWLDP